MSEKMTELFNLTQKAQKMELINEELALNIYLDIFENYTPKISKTYESGIRLLEKRQRYEEALKICDRAITLIKDDQISGVLDKFVTIHDRLVKKMGDVAPEVPAPKKKSYKWVLVLMGVLIAMWAVFALSTPHDDLNVNLEGKQSLPGGEIGLNGTTEDETEADSYPVTESMISIAVTETLKNHDALEITITPQDETIGLGILVSPGTDVSRSQALAEMTLKALAGAASATYKDLKAPSNDFLGGLYDHYELVISVGTGIKDDEIIAKGTKNKESTEIYWRSE